MGNGQKVVAIMLVAVLLLEFGSLTKLQKIWGLAFDVPENATPDLTRIGTSPTPNSIVLTSVHPGGAM